MKTRLYLQAKASLCASVTRITSCSCNFCGFARRYEVTIRTDCVVLIPTFGMHKFIPPELFINCNVLPTPWMNPRQNAISEAFTSLDRPSIAFSAETHLRSSSFPSANEIFGKEHKSVTKSKNEFDFLINFLQRPNALLQGRFLERERSGSGKNCPAASNC